MTTTTTQKTPSADLAGYRAEGLNSPLTKKESTSMLPNEIRLDEGSTIEVAPYADGGVELYAIIGPRTIGVALTEQEAQTVAAALLEAIQDQARTAMSPAKAATTMREARR